MECVRNYIYGPQLGWKDLIFVLVGSAWIVGLWLVQASLLPICHSILAFSCTWYGCLMHVCIPVVQLMDCYCLLIIVWPSILFNPFSWYNVLPNLCFFNTALVGSSLLCCDHLISVYFFIVKIILFFCLVSYCSHVLFSIYLYFQSYIYKRLMGEMSIGKSDNSRYVR